MKASCFLALNPLRVQVAKCFLSLHRHFTYGICAPVAPSHLKSLRSGATRLSSTSQSFTPPVVHAHSFHAPLLYSEGSGSYLAFLHPLMACLRYECRRCQNSFTSGKSYFAHLRLDARHSYCNSCFRDFETFEGLLRHTCGEVSYWCKACSHDFRSPQALVSSLPVSATMCSFL